MSHFVQSLKIHYYEMGGWYLMAIAILVIGAMIIYAERGSLW